MAVRVGEVVAVTVEADEAAADITRNGQNSETIRRICSSRRVDEAGDVSTCIFNTRSVVAAVDDDVVLIVLTVVVVVVDDVEASAPDCEAMPFLDSGCFALLPIT